MISMVLCERKRLCNLYLHCIRRRNAASEVCNYVDVESAESLYAKSTLAYAKYGHAIKYHCRAGSEATYSCCIEVGIYSYIAQRAGGIMTGTGDRNWHTDLSQSVVERTTTSAAKNCKQPESTHQKDIKIYGATTGHRNSYIYNFEATSKVSATD